MKTTQIATSPLREVSDQLDRLPIKACLEASRRPFTSNFSLHTGEAPPRAVLMTEILFLAEYGSTPWENGTVKNPLLRLMERGVNARSEA